MIQRGDADAMICGGTEAAVTPMGIGGFAAMRALSTRNDEPERASRPWDRERDGFVVGEGAGILILEELEHARRRGASSKTCVKVNFFQTAPCRAKSERSTHFVASWWAEPYTRTVRHGGWQNCGIDANLLSCARSDTPDRSLGQAG